MKKIRINPEWMDYIEKGAEISDKVLLIIFGVLIFITISGIVSG